MRRLPIKIITPQVNDFKFPTNHGGSSHVFGDPNEAFRKNLIAQIKEVKEYFSGSFKKFPSLPAVAVVKLHPDALAKSHRPDSLFNKSSCPIIGSRRTGELLVSVQSRVLDRLATNIKAGHTGTATANISTIAQISAYTSEDALQVAPVKNGGALGAVKLRPFNHQSETANTSLLDCLERLLLSLGGPSAKQLAPYGHASIYRIDGLQGQNLVALSSFVGTRSLSEFPRYRVLRTSSRRLGPATQAMFSPPNDAIEYPVLGIIDSGVDPNSSFLSPWIAARMWAVANSECDHGHGTFVGALAIHPRQLNNRNSCFPVCPCKLLDIVAFPKSGELPEDELLQAIEGALKKHPEVRVWNLSLSSNVPCSDNSFSDLGMALDELCDLFDVTFVIATGNYGTPPFRGWPAENLGEEDRVGSPGDSARAITVGSIAHLDSGSSRVKREHPSPFSRRGPGAAFLPKPEVTHYAGNCDADGNCIQTGVVSLDGSGFLVEDIGTSYAAPLVASTLATIYSEAAERMSSNLGKALLIHSAALKWTSARESDRAYFGFGVPGAVEDVLSCSGSSATLVFEPELLGSRFFEKSPFPFPNCLRLPDGRVFGDILMTLVYDPPLDPAWGLEYCRANVEVSLGSYDMNKEGKREHKRRIPPEETDYRKMYERELIKNGFKWSPVKVYRKKLQRLTVDTWRLVVAAEFRKGYEGSRLVKPALIITISDPNDRLPVYDEVVVAAKQQGWIIDDLRLRQQIRAAATS